MAYNKINFVNDETDASAENFDHMEDGIVNSYNVSLLAVSETAPSECEIGDKYYNTTTKKIYTATSEDTWGTTGEDPISDILYIVLEERTSYTWDGTDLVSVGGGSGSEIVVGDEEPTEDTKLIIEDADLDMQFVEEKNIITASLSSNYTASTSDYEILPLTSFQNIGNKLSVLNDGGILIGENVNNIKVSSDIDIYSVATTSNKFNIITRKRGTTSTNFYGSVSNGSERMSIVCIGGILSVQQGDIIYLKYSGRSGDILRGDNTIVYTSLNIEVID